MAVRDKWIAMVVLMLFLSLPLSYPVASLVTTGKLSLPGDHPLVGTWESTTDNTSGMVFQYGGAWMLLGDNGRKVTHGRWTAIGPNKVKIERATGWEMVVPYSLNGSRLSIRLDDETIYAFQRRRPILVEQRHMP
jgi:hypothetical protein